MKSFKSENLWAQYQRLLAFEEPAKKCQYLLKESGLPANSSSPDNNLPYSQSSIANRLFNVLLAHEQAASFELRVLDKLKDLTLDKALPRDRIDYWQKQATVTRPYAQWLTLAEIYWPCNLAQSAVHDSRLDFLSECCQALAGANCDWLQSLKVFHTLLTKHRSKLPSDLLPSCIVLVEGLSEQLLLPCLAASKGLDLRNKAIYIVPAGGANKIVRKYYYWRERIKLPILSIFDSDAKNLANALLPDLRNQDSVFSLNNGELEDLLHFDFLLKQINNYFEQDPLFDKNLPITAAHFEEGAKRTLSLNKIWRQRELGNFEKVKFAQYIAAQYSKIDYECISDDGKEMLIGLEKFMQRNDL